MGPQNKGGLTMKEATLKQAGKVLDLIRHKETSCEQLQKLLGSGLLSDLLDANIDTVDRNAFRQIIGFFAFNFNAYAMTVNYDRSVKDSIKTGNYDRVNSDSDIVSKHFPSQETGRQDITIGLVHFGKYGKYIETDEVIRELNKNGLRPATLKELLVFGEKYPDFQRDFSIIALGSVWNIPGGYRGCACLDGDVSERSLSLCWIGDVWDDSCRFAAVRK